MQAPAGALSLLFSSRYFRCVSSSRDLSIKHSSFPPLNLLCSSAALDTYFITVKVNGKHQNGANTAYLYIEYCDINVIINILIVIKTEY
jgi:hypothetical protein